MIFILEVVQKSGPPDTYNAAVLEFDLVLPSSNEGLVVMLEARGNVLIPQSRLASSTPVDDRQQLR